ncbi:peptidase [Phenylobacterium sp.]|uniref:peptidase n=1 Tax=Phenylobacterium sp. TaxID=1871053 RepID=UPI0030F456EA
MTYCVGLLVKAGLVFMSDTRTNSGVDNISVYRKMFSWTRPGERMLTLMAAGNLATTQAVISRLDERAKLPEDRNPSLLQAPTMFQAAGLVGETLKEVVRAQKVEGEPLASMFNATLILGGQIRGSAPRLFLIYPEGNFIEATVDTPFLQIGEAKYGRPILVRAHRPDMTLQEAAKLLMVSFDSTLKANLSVGMPLDVQIYETDSFTAGAERRIETGDAYFNTISRSWGTSLNAAFSALPDPDFP